MRDIRHPLLMANVTGLHTRVRLFDTCLSRIFHKESPLAPSTLLSPSRSRRDAASARESPFLRAVSHRYDGHAKEVGLLGINA